MPLCLASLSRLEASPSTSSSSPSSSSVTPIQCLRELHLILPGVQPLTVERQTIHCFPHLMEHLAPGLQSLAITAAQIPSGDLRHIARLTRLHTLRLSQQHLLRASDFDVLPRCRTLSEVTLSGLEHVPLQRREWMDDIGRPVVVLEGAAATAASTETTKEDAFAAPLPAAAAAAAPIAPDLLTILAGCDSLRRLQWHVSPRMLKESEAYTSSRTWLKLRGGVISDEERRGRADKEKARERHALRQLITRREDKIKKQQLTTAAAASTPTSSSTPLAAPLPLLLLPLQVEVGFTEPYRSTTFSRLYAAPVESDDAQDGADADGEDGEEDAVMADNEEGGETARAAASTTPAAAAAAETAIAPLDAATLAGMEEAEADARRLATERRNELAWARAEARKGKGKRKETRTQSSHSSR